MNPESQDNHHHNDSVSTNNYITLNKDNNDNDLFGLLENLSFNKNQMKIKAKNIEKVLEDEAVNNLLKILRRITDQFDEHSQTEPPIEAVKIPIEEKNFMKVVMSTKENFIENIRSKSDEIKDLVSSGALSRSILQSVVIPNNHNRNNNNNHNHKKINKNKNNSTNKTIDTELYLICAANERVCVFSMGKNYFNSSPVEKRKMVSTAKFPFVSDIVSIVVNPMHPQYFAVCGLKSVVVYTLNTK
eukprot:Pgem_evm1s1317